MRATLSLMSLLVAMFICSSSSGAAEKQPETQPSAWTDRQRMPATEVFYDSHGAKLKGLLFKPEGNGPFPVVLWNHGSEKDPIPDRAQGAFWTSQGFVFFKPLRSGHGGNPGSYICDEEKSPNMSFDLKIRLHEKANDDVIAALSWISSQSFVDRKQIIVGGGSYGGIQTLLTAERSTREKLGIRCFLAMSPAAMSWSPAWAQRLTAAVKTAEAPIFLIQAQNDFNLGPSQVLGPIVTGKGQPNRAKIFPRHVLPGADPNDHTQGHGQFFKDPEAWKEPVLAFLHDCGIH